MSVKMRHASGGGTLKADAIKRRRVKVTGVLSYAEVRTSLKWASAFALKYDPRFPYSAFDTER